MVVLEDDRHPLAPQFMKAILSFVLLAAASCVASAQVLVNFNSSSDVTLFQINGTTDYAWNSTAGTGGTGGLLGSGTNAATYAYTGGNATFDLSAGPQTLSLDFKVNWTNGTNRAVGQLGFLGASSMQFASGQTNYFLSTRLSTTTTTNTWILQSVQKNQTNDSNVTTADIGSGFTLTNGYWYRHEVTFTRTGTANTFSLSGSIFSLGSTGTSTPSLVTSYSNIGFTNSLLYGDTTLVASFRSRGTESPNLDNFSVIPEPSSLALMGVGASLLLFARRRRVS